MEIFKWLCRGAERRSATRLRTRSAFALICVQLTMLRWSGR